MLYPGTSTPRPEEQQIAGYGNFCCVPLCKSSTLDKQKLKTGIGMFSFPSESRLRKLWISIISKYRRKGGDDIFTVSKNTKICEFHFEIDRVKLGYGAGRKTLLKDSVPTIFKFKETNTNKKRKSPKKRALPTVVETESESVYESSSSDFTENTDEQSSFFVPDVPNEFECLKTENAMLKEKLSETVKNFTEELNVCKEKFESLKIDFEIFQKHHKYSYDTISCDGNLFQKATGLTVKSFISLYTFLDPGDKCSNVKFYENARSKADVTVDLAIDMNIDFDNEMQSFSKRGPKPKLHSIDQLFNVFVMVEEWIYSITRGMAF